MTEPASGLIWSGTIIENGGQQTAQSHVTIGVVCFTRVFCSVQYTLDNSAAVRNESQIYYQDPYIHTERVVWSCIYLRSSPVPYNASLKAATRALPK